MNTPANPERATGCGAVLVLAIVALIFILLASIAFFVIFTRVRESTLVGVSFGRLGSQPIAPVEPAVPTPVAVQPPPPSVPQNAMPAEHETAFEREAVAGPWLSDLKPLEVVGVDLRSGELRRSVTLGGRTRPHGLRARPMAGQGECRLSYSLDGQYVQLRGVAGIQASGGGQVGEQERASSVVFRIYGDGNLLWESEPLREPGAAAPLDLNLSGVAVLALVVDCSDSAVSPDCVWGDLELVVSAR
ncbi:MAG: NPCBM/NEW2 domain-containing protein [Planctomycetota bacterium]|nr:NPCBM/NEW2 domain-containing protein [Planctomycetota bacterium]